MTTTRSASSMVLMPLLWVAFALLVVATMFVLLRACGLVLPGYGSWHRIGFAYCSARATPAQVDEDRTRALRELARQLELRVVQQQATCLSQLPPPVAPPAPLLHLPTPPPTPCRPRRRRRTAPSSSALDTTTTRHACRWTRSEEGGVRARLAGAARAPSLAPATLHMTPPPSFPGPGLHRGRHQKLCRHLSGRHHGRARL